jgi:hypothetical protein
MQQPPTNISNPRWWTAKHDSTWTSARDEFRRDPAFSNDEQWTRNEPGIKYGYGAATQYTNEMDWSDRLEMKLREEWNDLKTGKTWDEVKSAVRRGWDSARRSKPQKPS